MPATNPCKYDMLRRAQAWIFDLDNTLYHPSADLFSQINRHMTAFIMREVGVAEVEANRLRSAYWAEYGNTLAGLVARHGVSAEAFLWETHQLDLSALAPDPHLRSAITALPGQLFIHTNGPRMHADRVLTARGLDDLFHHRIAIEDTDLVPKPQVAAYDAFARQTNVVPGSAVMFEDHADNLIEPHRRGMVTVWLAHDSAEPTPAHVDIRVQDLTAFLIEVAP